MGSALLVRERTALRKTASRGPRARAHRPRSTPDRVVCYQDGKFIGIAGLRPLCLHLQEDYDVTIIFDASIRPLLSGPADKSHWITGQSLRQRFPDTTLHIVAARTQADETILAAAVAPTVYVLSKDRFSEYADKPAVRERRLITHEILNGQILVHDLDINVPFGSQS